MKDVTFAPGRTSLWFTSALAQPCFLLLACVCLCLGHVVTSMASSQLYVRPGAPAPGGKGAGSGERFFFTVDIDAWLVELAQVHRKRVWSYSSKIFVKWCNLKRGETPLSVGLLLRHRPYRLWKRRRTALIFSFVPYLIAVSWRNSQRTTCKRIC